MSIELKEMRKAETLNTVSIKSLHKRQDKADEMREELSGSSHKTHDVVVSLANDLGTHMKWEEEEKRLDKIAKEEAEKKAKEVQDTKDKAQSLRLKIYGVLFTVFFALTAWWTSFVFNFTQVTATNDATVKQYIKHKDAHDATIDTKLDKIVKALYSITGNR